jgi:CheY-like chemotaxis protein
MDHMMPKMDGIEAAKHIRQLEGAQDIPIVVLTANAVSGARQMFLDAGMNDFISKPIRAAELNSVLKKWLAGDRIASSSKAPGSEAGLQAGGQAAKSQSDIDAILDKLDGIEGLDVDQGLTNTGEVGSAYLEVLRLYCVNLDADMAEMRQAVANEDWAAYRIRAHGLKGELRAMGVSSLGDWGFKLENAGKEGDGAVIRAETEPFMEALVSLRGELLKRLQEEGYGEEEYGVWGMGYGV